MQFKIEIVISSSNESSFKVPDSFLNIKNSI